MKIFLIGYRCTGKTTVGKILAERLHFGFIDTDRMIEQQTGSTILQFVETSGWEKFREIEKKILLGTRNLQKTVVSTGGGIVTDPESQGFIHANGYAVWLDADIKTILSRLNADKKTFSCRPSLTDKNLLNETEALVNLRKPLYEAASHIRIDAGSHTPEEIVDIIIDRRLSGVRQ